ncbi:LysR family transcriptional regulator [Novosphingobium colocasiae]|uniref:LysR family transcriptional regulator n=1 Tax=Novosphingobium colocasiae TaxID=1256513 RepID=A0A918PKV1_9SPHN|nr:LysR family transcriptional regulator [Novosphingobium colocasiae]GGZ13116.1 LysR family transcriptional regulator [Novosphingobium colocasiae]
MHPWEGLEEAVAIADAGSFVGAARLLGVSTSHVSRSVLRLEERLNLILFNRTTRTVSQTEAGRGFIDQARRLIQERDELLAFAVGDGEPRGELRVTCSIAMGERFVAPILGEFADRHPGLSVVLDLTNRVVDIIAEGYDLAIRTSQTGDPRLASQAIASRALITAASPAYLTARAAPRRVDDLAGHECLAGTTPNWHFLERGMPRVVTPRGRWRCNSGTAVLDAALAGRGICQLPEFYLRAPIAEGRLQALLEDCRAEPEPIWLVSPLRRQLQPKVLRLSLLLGERLQPALSGA